MATITLPSPMSITSQRELDDFLRNSPFETVPFSDRESVCSRIADAAAFYDKVEKVVQRIWDHNTYRSIHASADDMIPPYAARVGLREFAQQYAAYIKKRLFQRLGG